MSRGELARLMNLAAVMLANAAEDVADGHYTGRERADLAEGLDQLSGALRDGDVPAMIEGDRRCEKR